MIKKVTTVHFILIVISIIIGVLMVGCELPTGPTSNYIDEVNMSNLAQRQRGCELIIVPELPQMESGEYIFYVPEKYVWSNHIPIGYIAPEHIQVEWNINWLQMNRVIPPFYSYSNSRCQGEIDVLIYPSYVGWAASITADTGTEFDSIIIVVLEEGDVIDNGKQK